MGISHWSLLIVRMPSNSKRSRVGLNTSKQVRDATELCVLVAKMSISNSLINV